MPDFCLIDPDATPAENVEAVLCFLDEVERGDAWEREQAAALCERHRGKITRGNPPLTVLRAVERGHAPSWVVGALRDRFTVGADARPLHGRR